LGDNPVMDFAIASGTQERLDGMRAFVTAELEPRERELARGFNAMAGELAALRAAVRERGWWAPGVPRELGGMGLGLVDLGLVSEVVGRSPLGHYVFGMNAPDAGNVELLHLHGTAEQRERWLRPLAAGEIRSCFAMTEPDRPGSNPVLMDTTAVAEGEEWVIGGRKWFATGADGAAFAVVMAVTDPAAAPHERASMILVPTDAPGYRLTRNTPVMGHAGEGLFSHGEIAFEGCRVPRANLLGPAGAGFRLAQERLGPGRIHHCMRWLGICHRAFDLMCERALGRQLAPGERLADKDLVRAWIAESAAEIAAARWLTLHAAWTIERQGWKAAREEISLVKFQVAGTLQRVVDRALQVHGGLGMTDDTPLALFFREERAARIYDGADEVHKLAVARRILRGYEPSS
jgi:alkylation response protein AidB-like acyl-CoA dehydrogenase